MIRVGRRDQARRLRTAARVAGRLLGRIRADASVLLVVVAVMIVGTAAVAALPRVLDWLGDRSLASELEQTVISQRAIRVEALAPLPRAGGEDPFEELRQRGWDELGEVDPTVLDTLQPPQVVIDLPRLQIESLAGDNPADANVRLLTLRVQDGLEGHLRVVQGRLPDTQPGQRDRDGIVGDGLTLHEVALTPATATALDLDVGDRVRAVPDAQDAVARRVATLGLDPVAIEVVGLIELSDPDEDVWFADPRLHRPARQDPAATTFFAFGYVPVEAVDGLPGADQDVLGLVNWRFLVDAGAVTTSLAGTISDEVRRLEARTATVATGQGAVVHTDLGALLDREQARRDVAATTLTVAGLAVAGLAILLLALTARLVLLRRRQGVALQRSRGASPTQLTAAQAGETLLVVVPAGLIGWGLATVVVPGSGRPVGSLLAAAGLGLLALLLFVAGMALEARRRLSEVWRSPDGTGGARPVARVLELLALAAAAVSLVVLQQRGLDSGVGRNLLAASAPVLVAVAGGITAAHLIQLLARWAARRAARGRRLPATLGLARSGRGSGMRAGVVAVVFTLTTAVLAISIHGSLEAAQERVAWAQVGVPVRAQAPDGETLSREMLDRLPPDVDAVPGHRARTTVRDDGRSRQVDVLVTDPAALSALVDGLPVSFALPDDLTDTADPSGPDTPVPVVASAEGFVSEPTTIGDRMTVLLGGRPVEVEVVGVYDNLPAVSPTGAPWLLAPTGPIEQQLGRMLPWTELALRPGVGADAAARTAVQAADPGTVVIDRDQVSEQLRRQPLARGVAVGFQAVAWLSVAVATIAMAATSVLTAPARRRDLALLTALGSRRRQARAVALIELVPPLLAAIAAGSMLAAGLAPLVGASLDLAPFVADVTIDVHAAVQPAVAVTAVAVAATLAVAAAAAWRTSQASPATVLRQGDTT